MLKILVTQQDGDTVEILESELVGRGATIMLAEDLLKAAEKPQDRDPILYFKPDGTHDLVEPAVIDKVEVKSGAQDITWLVTAGELKSTEISVEEPAE